MTSTQTVGVTSLALLAAAAIFGASVAFAQTSVDADLEAELNAISATIDQNTALEVNVDALGTQADVSAQTGVSTDVDTEYAALFGDDTAMDGDMDANASMSAETNTGISAFFSAVFNFFFGWLR